MDRWPLRAQVGRLVALAQPAALRRGGVADWRVCPVGLMGVGSGAICTRADRRRASVIAGHVLHSRGALDRVHADPVVRLHGRDLSFRHGGDPGEIFRTVRTVAIGKIVQLPVSGEPAGRVDRRGGSVAVYRGVGFPRHAACRSRFEFLPRGGGISFVAQAKAGCEKRTRSTSCFSSLECSSGPDESMALLRSVRHRLYQHGD